MRLQLALNVENLEEAIEFYSKMFDVGVNKRKPGYANFTIDEPPLKLVLFENPGAAERLNHLGVEVFEDGEVTGATERLRSAGMAERVEDGATCCYATQNKVWTRDPQGMRWEWYKILQDSETFGASAGTPEEAGMSGEKRAGDADALRQQVRDGYTKIVEEGPYAGRADDIGRKIGYSDEDLEAVPEGANLGVGCGNPTAIDSLSAGETVVDLGSGAGMDAFLASKQVGPTGHVIGVDMTDAMLEKARENAAKTGITNVEFRKGQIEDLPIESESVDAIISNCVINLSPQKDKVYAEAYRVLKPGGRAMISDLVLERELPEVVLQSIDAYIGCVGGASLRPVYLDTIRKAGFSEVRVQRESSFAAALPLDDPIIRGAMEKLGITEQEAKGYAEAVTSLHILAVK